MLFIIVDIHFFRYIEGGAKEGSVGFLVFLSVLLFYFYKILRDILDDVYFETLHNLQILSSAFF